MQKIKGSVGPEVLRSLTPTPFANHKIVRAFRDYVEDRIENHYGVMATISISDEGAMEFELVAKDTVVTDKELEIFTRNCLKEFKENPINEAYNSVPPLPRVKRITPRPPPSDEARSGQQTAPSETRPSEPS